MFPGSVSPAVCLIAAAYASSNKAIAVCLIIAGLGLSGISCNGWGVNPLDLAPQYAGQIILVLCHHSMRDAVRFANAFFFFSFFL